MMAWLKNIGRRVRGDVGTGAARPRPAPATSVVSPMLSRLADEPAAPPPAADETDLRQAYLKSEAMLRDIRS